MRKIIALLALCMCMTVLCACNPTTIMVPVPPDTLPEQVNSTVASLLAASRNQDASTVLQLRVFGDGRVRTVDEIADALERNHDFWNYVRWTLTGAATSASAPGRVWTVTVELAYDDGHRLPVDIWLARREDRWVVTAVPVPPVLFAQD